MLHEEEKCQSETISKKVLNNTKKNFKEHDQHKIVALINLPNDNCHGKVNIHGILSLLRCIRRDLSENLEGWFY